MTGDNINVYGKVYLNIIFGNAIFHHVAYVADISDPVILGLDVLRGNNFKLSFKNNELYSSSENTKCEDIKPVHQVTATCKTTISSRTETIVLGIVNKIISATN